MLARRRDREHASRAPCRGAAAGVCVVGFAARCRPCRQPRLSVTRCGVAAEQRQRV